jgi:RNA polymerase sigma-70 factor (ECF subfamily)
MHHDSVGHCSGDPCDRNASLNRVGTGQGGQAEAGAGEALSPVISQSKPDDETVSVQTAPPVVVKTVPRAGDSEVDAAKVTEIRATFSKDMADDSWSWSQISDESFPKTTGKPHYEADKRTCMLPVKLEPGKTYVLWLNPPKFQGFRDADGHPAVFYPLVFATKK